MMQDKGVGPSATFSDSMELTLTTVVRDPTNVTYLNACHVRRLRQKLS